MPIQLIIFVTKNKIFASEINNDGQADAISINGNPDIKCEGKESADELIGCLFDAFSIDGFGDEHFDIVIVDCGGNKNVIAYATEKCADADKLSIIGMEKLLPLIVWNKTQLQAGEEIVAAFEDACYKVACDEKNIVRCTGKARKGKESITLSLNDFSCLYYLNIKNMQGGVVDTKASQEKDDVIEKLKEEKDNLAEALSSKEKSLTTLQKQIQEAKEQISVLNEEKAQWEADHPKPSDLVEQMVKVVEECKNNAEELGGDLYIRGNIPKRKLENAIDIFSEKCGITIDKNDIVALYLSSNIQNSKDSLNVILICKDCYCVDRCRNDTDNRICKNEENVIKWGKFVYAFHDLENDKYVDFKLNNGKVFSTRIDDDFDEERIIDDFLIPLLNKLKDVDDVE